MTKTLQIDESVHLRLLELQLSYRKRGISKTLMELSNEFLSEKLDDLKAQKE